MGGNIAGQLHPVDEHYDDRLDLGLDDDDLLDLDLNDEHDDDRLDLDLDDEHYDDRLDLDLNDKDYPPSHRPGCRGLAKGTPRGRLTL